MHLFVILVLKLRHTLWYKGHICRPVGAAQQQARMVNQEGSTYGH